ncbi:hypothetical protein FB451DRAFT_1263433 [Mycena latifolia]|nr:hypothetical protein FB451DRAFT_1263433 [Mycena latifolia]
MFRLATLTVAAVALFAGANAQDHLPCVEGGCWNSPANATDHGCATWDGGVNAWATCGFEGAVTCTTCLPCVDGGCYSSPNQLFGTGCAAFEGGVGAWDTCGFEGALICHGCPS